MKMKWRPSKKAKREFAEKMQNPEYAIAYYERKRQREERRRAESRFDYRTAGGSYVPTKAQVHFCRSNSHLFTTPEEIEAMNAVLVAYYNSEKVEHDMIHIVNEKIRQLKIVNHETNKKRNVIFL